MTTALIIGAGPGLSAALARSLSERGHQLVLAARDTSDLASLAQETGADLVDCDARDPAQMDRLFERVDATDHDLAVAIYNPSARLRGPIAELDPDAVKNALLVTAYGAFLMARHAAKRMLNNGSGTMLFTGASAGIKGFPESAPFAMGKFALRGLCQSLARELHPKNIHVAHVVIDGGIDGTPQKDRSNVVEADDNMLRPEEIARCYKYLIDQHRSTWTDEIVLRPWSERF
ncbi:MAG: SDR family oxidoreductase [Devosia sp.]